MATIEIIKANGDKEPFLENKVRESLKRAGANQEVVNKILVNLIGKLHSGMTTKEIYSQVFGLFNEYQSGHGFHYGLKNALMALGPSGYPFEKFIAKLFEHLGYQTQTQVIIKGKCIEHEVDVVIVKENLKALVECKFHNRQGVKSRSKDVLYTQARFEDIKAIGDYQEAWLVTNTKLTQNAINYGLCQGMKLLAWGYPQGESLERLIDVNQLYPVTCLSFLQNQELHALIQNDLIICQDLIKEPEKKLTDLGLSSKALAGLRSLSFS
jgi:hypothetical protein